MGGGRPPGVAPPFLFGLRLKSVPTGLVTQTQCLAQRSRDSPGWAPPAAPPSRAGRCPRLGSLPPSCPLQARAGRRCGTTRRSPGWRTGGTRSILRSTSEGGGGGKYNGGRAWEWGLTPRRPAAPVGRACSSGQRPRCSASGRVGQRPHMTDRPPHLRLGLPSLCAGTSSWQPTPRGRPTVTRRSEGGGRAARGADLGGLAGAAQGAPPPLCSDSSVGRQASKAWLAGAPDVVRQRWPGRAPAPAQV